MGALTSPLSVRTLRRVGDTRPGLHIRPCDLAPAS